jgi:lipoprotein-releasing system ATP-binding protein
MGMKRELLLKATDLSKEYSSGGKETLHVLRGAQLEVFKGEIVVIVGPSGSGKSTLLHLLSGLDRPTSGTITFAGQELFALDERALTNFRNARMGFIFQFHHLLQEFSAVENVAMPALIRGERLRDVQDRVGVLLGEVGLSGRLHHRPAELSGGEQQRVAVARALMNKPEVIFADEPSGNLDEEQSIQLHDLLVRLSREHQTTFVIATHNQDLTKRGERILRLTEGKLAPVKK